VKENCEVIDKIIPLLNCPDKFNEIEEHLLVNSNLPGPRGNLTLAYKFAESFETESISRELIDLLIGWANISIEDAPINDRREYLPFCGILSLGAHYYYAEENIKSAALELFRQAMNDRRWRIRESAAMGLQLIAEKDFNPIEKNFLMWYTDSNYLEKRAFLATLAHPPILENKEIVRFSLKMSDDILKDILLDSEENHRSEEFKVLSKGLQYCLSVFVTELPGEGFDLLKKYAATKNKDIIKIIKTNLGKSRLTKKHLQRVNEVLAIME
jgi:hypothetical protein